MSALRMDPVVEMLGRKPARLAPARAAAALDAYQLPLALGLLVVAHDSSLPASLGAEARPLLGADA